MRRHNLVLALCLVSLPAFADPQAPAAPSTVDKAPEAAPAAPEKAAEKPPEKPTEKAAEKPPEKPTEKAAEKPADPAATAPIAGYQGSFFLRDRNDWFVLFPKGRLQIDSYLFPNRGDLPAGAINNTASDPRPRDTIFARRARIEFQGTFAKHFEFNIAAEYAGVPGTGQYGTITDTFVNINYTPWAQIQIGQYDAPFTQENRTSDKTFDFMERSMAVRDLGIPLNKETGLMVWGYAPSKVFYYSAGVFNGEGQSFKNQDNWPAAGGRAFIAPLAPFAKGRRWMEELEVGGSFWWQHNSNLGLASGVTPSTSGGTQDDLSGMTTQGGVSFFGSNYKNGDARSHLAPDGTTIKWALEAHLPFKRYGLKWEYVHVSQGLAQYNDAAGTNGAVARTLNATGVKLDGYGTYVEAYAWILGGREAVDAPGIEPHPRLNFANPVKAPTWNLQVLAKWERLGFDVNGLKTGDAAGGHYAVDAVELGVNAWCTKHVRLTANYAANFIGGFSHGDATAMDNADAKNLKGNYFYKNNFVDHEVLFRIAIGL